MDNYFYYRGKTFVKGKEQSSYFFQTLVLAIYLPLTK